MGGSRTHVHQPQEPRWTARVDRWLERMAPEHQASRRDLTAAVVVLVLVSSMILFASWATQPDFSVDLEIYRQAAVRAWSGSSAYDVNYAPDGLASGLPYAYPPTALFLLAWATLPLPVAIPGLWLSATCALFVTLRAIVTPTRVLARPTSADARAAFLSVLLIATFPVLHSLYLGQVNLLLAMLIVVDSLGLSRTRYGGILIGVAASIKLTPAIFIIWLWASGRRRAAINAALTCVALLILVALLLPTSVRDYFPRGAQLSVSNNAPLSSPANQSLAALFERFGGQTPVVDLAVALVVATLALAGLVLATRLDKADDLPLAVTVLGLVSVSVAPIGWVHHFIWLPLVAVALWTSPHRGRRDRSVALVLYAVSLIPPFGVVNFDLSPITRPLTSLYFFVAAGVVIWLLVTRQSTFSRHDRPRPGSRQAG